MLTPCRGRTFAGWIERHDLAVKTALNIDPGETSAERDRAREALERSLRQRGIEATDFLAVTKYLADAPSRLLVVSMEDALAARPSPAGVGSQALQYVLRMRFRISEKTGFTLG